MKSAKLRVNYLGQKLDVTAEYGVCIDGCEHNVGLYPDPFTLSFEAWIEGETEILYTEVTAPEELGSLVWVKLGCQFVEAA